MPMDLYTLFIIILSGFMTVWSYREFSGSKDDLGTFEYIGFSAFWGMMLMVIFEIILSIKPEQIKIFFSNGFTAGIALSLTGVLVGCVAGHFRKNLHK